MTFSGSSVDEALCSSHQHAKAESELEQDYREAGWQSKSRQEHILVSLGGVTLLNQSRRALQRGEDIEKVDEYQGSRHQGPSQASMSPVGRNKQCQSGKQERREEHVQVAAEAGQLGSDVAPKTAQPQDCDSGQAHDECGKHQRCTEDGPDANFLS